MRLVALTLVAGVIVGGLGGVSDEGPLLVRWTSAIAAGRLIGAFVVGALAGAAWNAAAAGAATIVIGVGTYYVLFHFVSGTLGLKYSVLVGFAWSVVGVAIGAVIGWAGDAWRRRHARAIGAALLSGALVGEAILLLGQWENRAARIVLICELILGAMLPYALARDRLLRAIPLSAAVAVAVVVIEEGVRTALRMTGWAGA